MESKSQQMEKMIEAHCQQLLHDIVSLTILDLVACFIFFIIMRWIENVIENRFLFLPALLLQFLLSYLLDKLCTEYITLILSYIYISMCKSILPKSILKIDFSLVTRNRGKVFFSMCKSILPKSILKIGFSLVTRNRGKVLFGISTCFVMLASFLLEPSVRYYFQDSILFLFTSIVHNFTFMCKSILQKSILKIDFFLVTRNTRNRRKVIFGWQVSSQLHDTQYNKAPVIGEALNKTESTPEVNTKAAFSLERQESEPGLDEVKEAFSVFDQDRDGLVDAQDLQRVLINLGGGTDLEECQQMIAQHDRNTDGKVDLIDFSRLLGIGLLGNGD